MQHATCDMQHATCDDLVAQIYPKLINPLFSAMLTTQLNKSSRIVTYLVNTN